MAAKQGRRQVLFIINSLAGGGAERVMCTLLRASQGELRDHHFSLLLLDRETPAYDVPHWIEVEQLDCQHSLIRSVWSVYRAMRRLKPDLTVSFLTRANVANVIAAGLLGIRAIVSERVNTTSHLGRGIGAAIARFLVRATYPKARSVIAVSQGVADELHSAYSVPSERISVIANPIDLDEIRAQAEGGDPVAVQGPYAVTMGRLTQNKNFGMLIEAFARSGIPGKLVILGEGPERSPLSEKIEALGLSGRIVMPGFSANPFPTLRRAAFYVSPSNAEGFPNSLLEAMSVGLAVISTNCPSGPSEILADLPRERVTPGVMFAEHGILVSVDDPDAMADALRAMSDAGRRRMYGERAQRRAADFGVARACDAYWSIIRAQGALAN
ncbi:glycosyltransferase [Dongia deserti]|uniref:glycosyltransferase n=1 Tax=Dongia deserti TaxID=2268030 RepID=UPI0013C46D5D|nr:glycosyltransferase [Dongia deserti]